MAQEVLGAPWAVAALHNVDKSKERCHATITDTILGGRDGSWLFTSKSGEVMRKKGAGAAAVRDRFSRIALSFAANEHKFACEVRLADGRREAYTGEGMAKVLAEWPDPRFVAVQCYVPGSRYRNTYFKNGDDKPVHSTRVVGGPRSGELRHSDRGRVLTIPTVDTSRLPVSRASRLNSTLNEATLSLVKYLEKTQRRHLTSCEIEYVVDERGQLWLAWIGDVGASEYLPQRELPRTSSSNTLPSLASTVCEGAVHKQVNEAASAVEDGLIFSAGSSRAQNLDGGDVSVPGNLSSSPMKKWKDADDERWPIRQRRDSQTERTKRRFPTRLQCAGDYCRFEVSDPSQLLGHAELASLSRPSVQTLSGLLASPKATGETDLLEVAFKSIHQARLEKRGFRAIDDADQDAPWAAYPQTPRLELYPTGSSETTPAAARYDEDAAPTQQPSSSSSSNVLTEEPAKLYRSVRVCRNCFSIYCLLDRARDMLREREKQPQQRKRTASARETTLSSNPAEDSSSSSSCGGEKSPEKQESGTVETSLAFTCSETKRKARPKRQRDGPNWKARIPEDRLYGTSRPQPLKGGIQRFEELDAYLRGKSDAAARRTEAKAAAVARSRAAQAHVAESAGMDAGSLYFGRIMLIDSRSSEDTERITAILESAGFVVDVELDSRNALDALVEEFHPDRAGWQLDAVLVADKLDLGDAFQIVDHVRDREQHFRDRETKRVEDQAKKRADLPGSKRDDSKILAADYARLPVVILTASTSTEDLRAYKKSGMDGCVSKPVNRLALLSTLRAAVPRHGKKINQPVVAAATATLAAAAPVVPLSRSSGDAFPDVAVSFSARFDKRDAEKCFSERDENDDDLGGKAKLLAEVANQLGVLKTRVEIVAMSTDKLPISVGFTIRGFPDDLSGRAFVKALNARSQLVDEQIWGRNTVDSVSMRSKSGQITDGESAQSTAQALVAGAFGTAGAHTSSAMAAKSLSLPSSFASSAGIATGTLQLDADTSFPYCVVDMSLADNGMRQKIPDANTFNLVVCHDFFDTFERLKIVLTPLAAKYPGLQILFWNYPGQALTEWRDEQLLNNVYLANCLHELLDRVGSKGSQQFDETCPFYVLGYGFGGSVAACYATHYKAPNLRGLVMANAFSFVDPHLAGALHDSMNVFSCSPPSRPDLPVYFWTRFLFSREYLAKVSTPLALNLYTAVHNPITLKGRMKLCVGALSSRDVRPALKTMKLPVIAVHSTEGILVKPLHAQPWAEARCSTIHQALKSRKTCVVWLKSGHEIFQEARKQISTLLEQLLVGYHEVHDVAFVPAADSTAQHQQQGGTTTNPKGHGNFEDSFIDNVLGHVRATKQQGTLSAAAAAAGTKTDGENDTNATPNNDDSSWTAYQAAQLERRGSAVETGAATTDVGFGARRGKRRQPKQQPATTVLDPEMPAFERQDNVVYGPGGGSRIYPTPSDYPEVKEYMGWRLKRNRKRLQRLDLAARIIQTAFRNHLSWMVFQRLKRERAVLFLQRAWRGHRGRRAFMVQMRRIWASMVLQRAWRGYAGRGFFLLLRTMHAASGQIQRIARGWAARSLVKRIVLRRHRAATMMQALVRRWYARVAAFRLRGMALSARAVQRVYRGHLGRRRAEHERHKYLFSKSQSQGIEFGRQMLLEHKLHATRLQSEVSLLTQEKVVTEEAVEALLEEISEFEQGVNQLEKEMHQLSKIEAEAVGVLDEEAKHELREQKARLDREFGSMLAKIAERRDRLSGLEGKLATLDHARQQKEEQLRTLERKLVVLLEEQQRELDKIKRRQDARGELLATADGALVLHGGGGSDLASADARAGFSGPTVKEKKQCAQLMQSTETLMKFGFMSMSMTYFSSLNMIKAMRTVAAQDTVMGALHANNSSGNSGRPDLANVPYEDKAGEPFKPALQPGQMPGEEPLKVSAWSVEDVARWLQTLALGQYREAFVDAAVDGAFLYDLNDDDLKNTLGIEHRLHRKKILNMTAKLKAAEFERNRQLRIMASAGAPGQQFGGPLPLDEYIGGGGGEEPGSPSTALVPATGGANDGAANEQAPLVTIEELFALVRHGKTKKVREALEALPSRRFDPALVKVQFVEDFGTAYVDEYEREYFNLNKVDEHGNTPLIAAAQNGNVAIAKLLAAKGANPNHQNKMGQSAGHYANAYSFFDFLSWLFDPAGGGGDDTVENAYGLGVYDGLAAELAEDDGGGQ